MVDTLSLQTTVAARVAEQLRSEIRQGQIVAGTPLRQNDVAARLGVSSTPVREAFQILERLGLVERVGRRGVRVFRPSALDLTNGYEVRGALESLAAQLAAARVTEQELAALAVTMERMHAPNVSQTSFLRLNSEFHAQVAKASGNSRLAELIIAEQSSTTSFVVFLGVDATSAHEAHEEHAAILSAIAAKDPDAASRAMSLHLASRVDALKERLAIAEAPTEGKT